MNYEILDLGDWREEFYFLMQCKHKIIHCTQNSYSEGLWASVLNGKNYFYVAFDKKLKPSKKFHNWIAV